MAKIDLDSLSIEDVAALRDSATDKLMEKVAARRAELEAELEKLSQYDRPAKKSQAVTAPVAKARPSQDKSAQDQKPDHKADASKEPAKEPLKEATREAARAA
jgi:hypothetical protein